MGNQINKQQQLSLFSEDTGTLEDIQLSSNEYSDYVVYVDESGDHNLVNTNPDYPVFVLAFIVFHKRHYAEQVVPAVEKFKFNHFGHDLIVLHEHEIRKQKHQFSVLTNREKRNIFMEELTQIIERSNFVLISCVIDKHKLNLRSNPEENNPYHIALGHCLDSLYHYLGEKEQQHLKTHVLLECRGKREDQDLELEFRRTCDGNNHYKANFNFEAVFVHKQANSTGLQFADLVARPIGIKTLRPTADNRAFDVLIDKFLCKGGRDRLGKNYRGYGLKIVPDTRDKQGSNEKISNTKKAKSPDEPTET
ncbi:MAG: DUF3800 domain-containing protein [Gammaproteobacteria bacterium]|nr:DUF3800 domain-containing protein [Gammaproteobacteria bacterium]